MNIKKEKEETVDFLCYYKSLPIVSQSYNSIMWWKSIKINGIWMQKKKKRKKEKWEATALMVRGPGLGCGEWGTSLGYKT